MKRKKEMEFSGDIFTRPSKGKLNSEDHTSALQ